MKYFKILYNVFMYSEATKYSSEVLKVAPGEMVALMDDSKDPWYLVCHRGAVGYIYKTNLEEITEEKLASVNANVLNLRTGPGTIHPVGLMLNKDTKVAIIEDGMSHIDWLQVQFFNQILYAHKDYLKLPEKIGYFKLRKYDSDIHVYVTDPKTETVDVTKGKRGLEPLSSITNGKDNIVVKINGGMFQFDGSSEHLGAYLDEGTWDNNLSSAYANFILKNDGTTIVECRTSKYSDAELQKLKSECKWIIGTSYSLMMNGKIDIKNTQYFDHYKSKHPRTLIGGKANKSMVLVVADGRTSSSKGLTAQESANLMKELNCICAANLDGGGSSEMIVNGKIVNKPCDGTERRIGSAVIVNKL